MCFVAVKPGSVGCAADPAVLVAAEDDRAALVAPAREDLAGARAVGMVAVAAAGVCGEPPDEHVARPLEHSELGAVPSDNVVELA
jgi:hypothetical protein